MEKSNKKAHMPFFSCRTSFKRAAAISGLSLAAFITGTQYVLPEVVPGRGLTEGETELLQEIFADSVDYDKVKIHSSKLSEVMAVKGFDVFTIGNTIFYPEEYYHEDFSKAGMRSTFVHEAAHVWQHQNCQTDNVIHAMFNTLRAAMGWSPEENYEYDLSKGRDLTDYHAEHQASIISDYDQVRRGRYPGGLIDGYNKSMEEMEGLYNRTLENFIENPSYPKKDCLFP